MVKTWNDKLRICALCLTWYSISSLNNIINKRLLTNFPHPISLSLVHLLSSAVYLGPFLNFCKVAQGPKIPYRTFLQLIVPLGLGRVFGSVSAHVTIWKVPVSYAHTGMRNSILTKQNQFGTVYYQHSTVVVLCLCPVPCCNVSGVLVIHGVGHIRLAEKMENLALAV